MVQMRVNMFGKIYVSVMISTFSMFLLFFFHIYNIVNGAVFVIFVNIVVFSCAVVQFVCPYVFFV